jgi:hypothetical protein
MYAYALISFHEYMLLSLLHSWSDRGMVNLRAKNKSCSCMREH